MHRASSHNRVPHELVFRETKGDVRLGQKRTSVFADRMSAADPHRTSHIKVCGLPWNFPIPASCGLMPTNQAHRIVDPVKPRVGLPARMAALRPGCWELRELLSRHSITPTPFSTHGIETSPRSMRRQDPSDPIDLGLGSGGHCRIPSSLRARISGVWSSCMRLLANRANLPARRLALRPLWCQTATV